MCMHIQHKPASQNQRVTSFGIDLFVIIVLQAVFGNFTLWVYHTTCAKYGVPADHDMELFLSQFCGGFFFLGYFTLSLGLFGNTLGKRVMGLRVVKSSTQESLTMPEAYWRAMGYLMSSWTYMIGFILPWFRSDKLALHDLLCGTQVVRSTPISASSALQLVLPPHLWPHQNQILPTQEAPSLARTGTDR